MFYYLSRGLGLRYRLSAGGYTRTWMHTETKYLVLYAFMFLYNDLMITYTWRQNQVTDTKHPQKSEVCDLKQR